MSAQLKTPLVRLRAMQIDDLDAVFKNEVVSYTHPWTKNILHDCLKVKYRCIVAERDGELIGHAVMSAAVGEAHLLNIAVIPSEQGQGIGRKLLHRMIRIALEESADTLFLEVRQSNEAAKVLYESEGFCEVGQRRGYYPHDTHDREDAIVYAKPLL